MNSFAGQHAFCNNNICSLRFIGGPQTNTS